MLQLTQQVIGNPLYTPVIVFISKFLDSGHETRPGPGFEFVKHWSIMYGDFNGLVGFFSHAGGPVYRKQRANGLIGMMDLF